MALQEGLLRRLERNMSSFTLEINLSPWSCRVHTTGVHVSNLMASIFRGADLDSQMNYLARSLAYQVTTEFLAGPTMA